MIEGRSCPPSTMVEFCTGYLDFERLDAEVLAIAEDLLAFGIDTVYVSFGFGCDRHAMLQYEDVPVPTSRLVQFIGQNETDGTFDLGESDLFIEGGGVTFRLCHERDVHCHGESGRLLSAVRKRWTRLYEHSYEHRGERRWQRLRGRPKDPRIG